MTRAKAKKAQEALKHLVNSLLEAQQQNEAQHLESRVFMCIAQLEWEEKSPNTNMNLQEFVLFETMFLVFGHNKRKNIYILFTVGFEPEHLKLKMSP